MTYWIFSFDSEGYAKVVVKYENDTEKTVEKKIEGFDYNLNEMLDELLAEADNEA